MIDPATETAPEEYVICMNCKRTRSEHHYGPDGPGSSFIFKDKTLRCPANIGTFVEVK